jgi:hypothetical protein
MVHEYIRNPDLLAQAVNEAHRAVPMLVALAESCASYAANRGLL